MISERFCPAEKRLAMTVCHNYRTDKLSRLVRECMTLLRLTAEELKLGRRVTAEKAALARWLRERTTVSLPWSVSG